MSNTIEINGESYTLTSSIEKREFVNDNESILQLGTCYYVRTVTNHFTGRLIKFDDNFMVFEDACWIADSGRWADALKTGKLSEVEPYPGNVIVFRGAGCDMSEWLHDLPSEQK